MIPEAPFLFAIAALSASLAGLAGLVAGLRRGSDMRSADLYRLQEIVEFCFANIIMALSVVPLALIVDGIEPAIRIVAGAALAYQVVLVVVLRRRQGRFGLSSTPGWYVGAAIFIVVILVLSLTALVTGDTAAFEALLVVFLARPMFVFLLVLQSFDRS